jgi:hypothetical protein
MKAHGLRVALAISVAVSLAASTVFAQDTTPAVTITVVPPYDARGGDAPMARIGGSALNAPADARVVVFAHTDVWYVQPYVAAPYTAPRNGQWATGTHLGTEYVALLVTAAYRPPATTSSLPALGGPILAAARAQGKR